MNIIAISVFLGIFFIILVLNELLDKCTDWPREYHRKFGHVLSGITILVSTYYLNASELLVFSILILCGALASRLLKIKSLHQVVRKTYGTSLYALVCITMSVIWAPDHIDLFRLGILILTIPDALAAVIGSQWGKQIPYFDKSLLGSTVFFIGSLFVVSLFTQTWWIVISISLILTLIEFFSQWGIDNLLLPLCAGYLLLFFNTLL